MCARKLAIIGRPYRIALLPLMIVHASFGADERIVDSPGERPKTLEALGEQPNSNVVIPPALNERAVQHATAGKLPYESRGNWGMSPRATAEQVQAALARAKVPAISGPVKETWQSLDEHYKCPRWLVDGKFGIFIHFGLYSVPAVDDWHEKRMYSDSDTMRWHVAHLGPLDKFGYKDLIPLLTIPRFDANEWSTVFAESGAKWVMPTAEHCDGFSLWNSKVNRFNSVNMGPKRDVVGELGDAVRAHGMKFGATNHSLEHYDFIDLASVPKGVATDLSERDFADFYWVDHSNERMIQHLSNWVEKNIELIDQYQPDVLWFDNGLNHRVFDPLKIKVDAYYLNRAQEWSKEVTATGKGTCFIAGAIQDFEDIDRAPRETSDFPWMVHDRLTDTWGYTDAAKVTAPEVIIRRLVEVVSRNGVYALNVSPKGDGSIPTEQQEALRKIGAWLGVNGEGIYATRPWRKGEVVESNSVAGGPPSKDFCFTTKNGAVYIFLFDWPASNEVVAKRFGRTSTADNITKVELLGHEGELQFTQEDGSLRVQLPSEKPCEFAYCLKIGGLGGTQ